MIYCSKKFRYKTETDLPKLLWSSRSTSCKLSCPYDDERVLRHIRHEGCEGLGHRNRVPVHTSCAATSTACLQAFQDFGRRRYQDAAFATLRQEEDPQSQKHDSHTQRCSDKETVGLAPNFDTQMYVRIRYVFRQSLKNQRPEDET